MLLEIIWNDCFYKLDAFVVKYYIISCVERPVVTPSSHNVSLGTNITFECTEFGSPPFTYQWFMRNTSMEGSDKLLVGEDENTYNISSVLYNQTGLYFCEASNMLGILSNSTPASLIGENYYYYFFLILQCIPRPLLY